MKKVYIAGRYSADNVLDVLENIRKGTRFGAVAMLNGFIPYIPWLDHQIALALRNDERVSVEQYKMASIEWLKVCDQVWVIPMKRMSRGVKEEILLAKKLGIPVLDVFFGDTDETVIVKNEYDFSQVENAD